MIRNDFSWRRAVRRLRTTVAYASGSLLILLAAGVLFENNLRGATFFFLAGVLVLPVVRTQITERAGIWIGQYLTLLLVLYLAAVGFGSLESGVATSANDPIDKPATKLVIQPEQLGDDWHLDNRTGSARRATSTFRNPDKSAKIRSTARKYPTIEEAKRRFDERKERVTARNDIETANVGHEGFSYVAIGIGNEVHVVFRDSNVIAELVYFERLGFDQLRRAKHFVEVMHRNFRK